MATITSSNVISILSDPKVSERQAKAPEAPKKAPEQTNSDAVVSEVRARDRVQSEEEAFALVGNLKDNILSNRKEAFQAQANQQPEDTQILLA